MAIIVNGQNRRIIAVRKRIVPNQSLSRAGVAVGVDESADCRVIVSGLEIVEAGFGILVIAPVAQGVDLRHGAAGTQDLAEGIVEIRCYLVAAAVYQIHHIALEVRNVIVDRAGGPHGVGQGVGRSALVIPEVQNLRAAAALHGLPQQLAVGDEVQYNCTSYNNLFFFCEYERFIRTVKNIVLFYHENQLVTLVFPFPLK